MNSSGPGINLRIKCKSCNSNFKKCLGFGNLDILDIVEESKCGICQKRTKFEVYFKRCDFYYEYFVKGDNSRRISKVEHVMMRQTFHFPKEKIARFIFRVQKLGSTSTSPAQKKKKKNKSEEDKKAMFLHYENDDLFVSPDPYTPTTDDSLGSLKKKVNKKKKCGSPVLRIDAKSAYRDGREKKLLVDSPKANGFENVFEQKKHEFEIIDSEIQKESMLGEGSFGTVWKGTWGGSGGGQEVAIKEILMVPDYDISDIMKEFKLITELHHPKIIRVYGFSWTKDYIRIVMDLMDGDVTAFVDKHKLTMLEKFNLLEKMTRSIHYLHQKGVIHRDVKSMNFLQRFNGRDIVVTDFGLSCTYSKSETFRQSKARGSICWIAPEILSLTPKYSVYSDIYALGVTFWEVLFEQMPYKGLSAFIIMDQVMQNGLRPSVKDVRLPDEMKELMECMWVEDPRDRPNTETILEWFAVKRKLFQKKYNKRINLRP